MAAKTNSSRRILMIASLCLVAGAGWLGYREAAYYLYAGATPDEHVATVLSAALPPGPSASVRRLMLSDCATAINTARLNNAYAQTRTEVYRRCGETADAIAGSNPADSYAWYLGAYIHGLEGDTAGLNERLRKSQETAPGKQWLGVLRVALAENNYADLTEAVRTNNDKDLLMLVRSRRGIEAIARRYITQPQFRERITAIVETLEPAYQATFLTNVRNAARRVQQAESASQ